jgi:hypothetical protein
MSGSAPNHGSTFGKAVDAVGVPVIDPTRNVQDLSEASNKRQDDLRDAQNKYMEAEIRHLKDLGSLRAEHQKELSAKESQRLDSIRQVDQLAVTTAATRTLDAVQALAVTTTANADNLRNAQAAMAATIASQTATQVGAITERLAALEKSSYEGAGKQAYSDPMMAQLVSEMKALREASAGGVGRDKGIGISWAVLFAVVVMFGTLLTVYAWIQKSNGNTVPTVTPQVVYVPAPAGTPK